MFVQSIATLEYFDQEVAKLKGAFLVKNVDVLLIQEPSTKGKRRVEEAKKAEEELLAKLAMAESEVGWLSTTMGTF